MATTRSNVYSVLSEALLFEFRVTRNHEYFSSFTVSQPKTGRSPGHFANPSFDRTIQPLGNGLGCYSNFRQIGHAEMILFGGHTNIEYVLYICLFYLSYVYLLHRK